jgi:hypothetical protein
MISNSSKSSNVRSILLLFTVSAESSVDPSERSIFFPNHLTFYPPPFAVNIKECTSLKSVVKSVHEGDNDVFADFLEKQWSTITSPRRR